MFVYEVQKLYPELITKARKAISFDDLIIYLAGCETKEQAYNFLYKFDWENTLRSHIKPEITINKVYEQWEESYQGYTEKTTYFSGLYCDQKVEAALTVHNHEDGNIEYFFAWK